MKNELTNGIRVTERTAEGLRDLLFDAIEKVLDDSISAERVQMVALLADGVLKTAKAENDRALVNIEVRKREMEDARIEHEIKMQSLTALSKTVEAIEVNGNDNVEL